MFEDMEKEPATSVLYNADCPVCRFEIRHYEQYANDKALPIRFDDLNTDAGSRWGLSSDKAARRLYVLHDGKLSSGVPAFLVLWSQMPRYKWLGRFVGLPVIKQIASMTYDRILAPALYHAHRRRLHRQAKR